MPDPYKTPVDMQDVYDEDAQKNKEFDKTLNPDGSFKKPSLEQLEKGSEIKNKMLNQVRSTGFEVGANIGLDKATNWLLAAPFPGARLLYGGANFLGSAGINIYAQRIRGEEGIKWGEAAASGGMSLVPYMPFAAGKYTKYLGEPWSVQRGVVGGAVTGVGHEAIRVGIDEKRLPSPIETGLGATVGGAVGGAIPAVTDTAKRMIAQIQGISPMGDLAYGLGGTGGASAMKGSTKAAQKISTNERLKQSLIANEVIELPPAYKGGPVTFREEADFFDVSAALIGGGQEDARDALGRKIVYNRAKVTEFGATRSERRDMVFNHIKNSLRRNKKDGTGTNITRKEFNEYAKEQIAAEKNLRKAIKLLNIRSYASLKNIDLSDYPTSEAQLELLNNINKAKVKPRRGKTDTTDQFQNKVRKWQRDTAPYQQFTDYKETFDYGHIISAKTGFRAEDLGMNRISNTEIEAAHNVASIDPYTRKIIEILQEGNRERGSRRDYLPVVQRMRNTAGSVVEDFVKWKANKDNDPVNLTKILDKFIPRDQHDNYLQFIQKKFYQKRALGYATIKEFVEEVYGFDYKIFKDMPQKLKNKVEKEYLKQRVESGNITGKQQYDQAGEWMLEAIDEFIGLHHLSKPKRLRTVKEDTQLQDLDDLPKDIDDLMDMILPDRLPNE